MTATTRAAAAGGPAAADDTTGHILDYGTRPGSMKPGPHRTPPELINCPLAQRLSAMDDGALTPQQWAGIDEDWFGYADARYRAVVSRRPMPEAAPPLRIGVKDTVDVAGLPTTLGLRRHRHHPTTSAGVLRGINDTRAAITTKVVTTELNIGVGSGCVNPYAPEIDPAGSSTGAAVAVAAGLVDIALGTDVLGSVRWPAGNCGTVGLRTTHDFSALDGVFPLSPPMDALGWVARTAEDLHVAARALALPIAHSDAYDPAGRCRVGVVTEAVESSSEAMATTLRIAATLAADAGAAVAPVRLGELWNVRGPAWELCARQAWDAYTVWRSWFDTELTESTRAALAVGAAVSDTRYRETLAMLAWARSTVLDLFVDTGCDVWIMPLDPQPPPTVAAARATSSTIPRPEDSDYATRIGFTPIASVAGIPALTLPISHQHGDGAPLCVQLLGRPGTDLGLVRYALDLERHRGALPFHPR